MKTGLNRTKESAVYKEYQQSVKEFTDIDPAFGNMPISAWLPAFTIDDSQPMHLNLTTVEFIVQMSLDSRDLEEVFRCLHNYHNLSKVELKKRFLTYRYLLKEVARVTGIYDKMPHLRNK